jgi:ribose/xylose/arabinose/galactoside ABC-type transport system permease subunit
MPSVIMLIVLILNGIMLSVGTLIVVAPVFHGLSVEEKKSFNDIETSSFVLGSIIQGLKEIEKNVLKNFAGKCLVTLLLYCIMKSLLKGKTQYN